MVKQFGKVSFHRRRAGATTGWTLSNVLHNNLNFNNFPLEAIVFKIVENEGTEVKVAISQLQQPYENSKNLLPGRVFNASHQNQEHKTMF